MLRRENSAVRFCFGMFGFTLGLDLPDEIFEHPIMMRLHLAAVDMVCWSNVSCRMSFITAHCTYRYLCRTSTPTTWSRRWDTREITS